MTAQEIYEELLTDFNHDRIETASEFEDAIDVYVGDAAYQLSDEAGTEDEIYDELMIEVRILVAQDNMLTNLGTNFDLLNQALSDDEY